MALGGHRIGCKDFWNAGGLLCQEKYSFGGKRDTASVTGASGENLRHSITAMATALDRLTRRLGAWSFREFGFSEISQPACHAP